MTIVACLLAGAPLALGAAASAQAHHRSRHDRRHGRVHRRLHIAGSPPLPWLGPLPSPSLFGLNTDIYDTNHALYVQDVPAARGLGARWDRHTVGPKAGEGNYGALDWEVRQDRAHGMGVVLSFAGIARACSLRPPPANVTACPPTTPADLSAYGAFVRAIVLRYRNVVDYYESWVEPNNAANFTPGPQPAVYAALLVAEWRAIQAVNARYGLHVKLLFGSPIGFSIIPGNPRWTAVLPWTQQVLDDLHGLRPFDGVGLLAYRFPPGGYGPPAAACDSVGTVAVSVGYATADCPAPAWRWMSWPQELQAYEQVFADHGYGQPPLWLTEFGWPGNALPTGAYFPGDAAQALYLTEAYADLLQLPFVKAAFWFNVRDYQQSLASPDPTFFYHYGLLNYNLTSKPAALAFRALALANPGR